MGAKAAAAALWTTAVLFAGLAAVRVALYANFHADSAAGCASERNPGYVTACEQLAPISWYLPYWLSILGSVVFAALFASVAVLASRGRGPVRFAMAATISAILLAVVPGAFDLGWRFAMATTAEADRWVAEYVRDGVPSWFGPVETALLVLAAVAAVLGTEWLRRAEALR
jgi:hypothetical protein